MAHFWRTCGKKDSDRIWLIILTIDSDRIWLLKKRIVQYTGLLCVCQLCLLGQDERGRISFVIRSSLVLRLQSAFLFSNLKFQISSKALGGSWQTYPLLIIIMANLKWIGALTGCDQPFPDMIRQQYETQSEIQQMNLDRALAEQLQDEYDGVTHDEILRPIKRYY